MIDPLEQALAVVRQYWPQEPESVQGFSTLETVKGRALSAQEDRDWLVASVFRYKTLDAPQAFIILLWRHLGSGDTTAKIQVKPVLIHWDVDKEEYIIAEITRME